MEVQVFQDLETLSIRAAEFFVETSNNYISSKGKFAAAVSGGSTPVRLFALLGSGLFRDKVDWHDVHIFMVDERFVPSSHKDSNYRILHENLLSKIPIPGDNVHPVKTDEPSPQISAKKYEEEMRKFFGLSKGSLPEFDIIFLGIGEDGHTASLFPGSNVLEEKERLAVPVMTGEMGHYRITLTLPVINNAENVIFLVGGRDKAEVLKKVLEDREPSLPACRVEPKKGKLFYLLDKAAGSHLSKRFICPNNADIVQKFI